MTRMIWRRVNCARPSSARGWGRRQFRRLCLTTQPPRSGGRFFGEDARRAHASFRTQVIARSTNLSSAFPYNVTRTEKPLGLFRSDLDSCFDAFSSREPVSTPDQAFARNALAPISALSFCSLPDISRCGEFPEPVVSFRNSGRLTCRAHVKMSALKHT
jgi:hypothetical protein